jgi:hypothetical protein
MYCLSSLGVACVYKLRCPFTIRRAVCLFAIVVLYKKEGHFAGTLCMKFPYRALVSPDIPSFNNLYKEHNVNVSLHD